VNYLRRQHIDRKLGKMVRRLRPTRTSHRRDARDIKRLLRRKLLQRFILLNPGPVLTSAEVKNSLIQYDMCHRDQDFSNLVHDLKLKCLPLFGADERYRVLFISGSGTAAMEAMLASILPDDSPALVLSNGAFGERLQEICLLHEIPHIHVKKAWGEQLELAEIRAVLQASPEISSIVLNHHETSVGLLNQVSEIGALAREHNALFLVDAISSLGAEPISMIGDHIDACVTSSNKCIHSIAGVSLVCVRKEVLDGIEHRRRRSFYLDLYKHYRYLEELNQTPYTPAVTSFFALDQAVDELLAEGLEARQLEYEHRNRFLRRELAKLGFEFFTDTGEESRTILTVRTPPDISYRELYNRVKEYGFLIYDAKPPLDDHYFQIANMGDLNDAMLYDFIFVVKRVLRDLRR
jgi:2-aminoethylphosphonate-pyruvate transaminase